jgi:hypothetical protein
VLSCAVGHGNTVKDWFLLDATLMSTAGRAASDFWKDSERHLKAALAAQPGAVDTTITLVQVPIITLLHGKLNAIVI